MFKAIFSKLRKDAGLVPVEVNASFEDLRDCLESGAFIITESYTFKEMGVNELGDERDLAKEIYTFVKNHPVLNKYPNLHILKKADHPNNLGVIGYVTEFQNWALMKGIQLGG